MSPLPKATTRTHRALAVLSLFTTHGPQLRAARIAELLDVSLATAYRCLSDLTAVGLVEDAGGGDYVPGPAIVELDRQIRLHDPLIAAAREPMATLAERTGGTVLLCRLHGLKVMCVHQHPGRLGPSSVSYERGRAMPLLQGATSKAILAHLDDASVRELIEHDPAAFRRAGLEPELEAVRQRLSQWRRQPVLRTAREVDPDAMGWAVPLIVNERVIGSLSVVLSRAAEPASDDELVEQLDALAHHIEARYAPHP